MSVKKELTIKELFELKDELKALLAEKVSVLTRFKLKELSKETDNLLVSAEETKNELITKYGTAEKDGTVSLNVHLDEEKKTINPKFEEFIKEWTVILTLKKELKYTPLDLKLIETINTDKDINILFELLEK